MRQTKTIMTSGQPELHTKTKSTASACYTWEFRETVTTHIRHAEIQTRQNPWKEKWIQSLPSPANQNAIYNWYQLRRENEFPSKDVNGCVKFDQYEFTSTNDCICVHVCFLFCFCISILIDFPFRFFLLCFDFLFLWLLLIFLLFFSFYIERNRMWN